jgi:hypothetical protein
MVSKTKKPTQKTVKRLSLKKPGQLVVIILLAIVVGLLVKQQVRIHQDRQLFKQAEAKTEEIYSQIVETIGEPDKVVREKNCGRASRKFEQGPLSCSINIQLVLYGKDNNRSWALVNEVSKLNESPLRKDFLSKTQSQSFDHYRVSKERQIYFQSLENLKNLVCETSYEYPVNNKSAYYDLLEPEAPENLRIGVTCGGPAKTQHYPLGE